MSNQHEEYKDHPVYKKLIASGPKRILSLDGGGIKGALTLGYLEKLEEILRKRYNNPDFVLSDYFDLVGGTSTGAIIATFVALGKPVAYIRELYLGIGKKIFTRRKHPFNWGMFKYALSAEYTHKVLERELDAHPDLKGLRLGSERFKTGLAIFAKRADTFSTFVFHNHPRNEYYQYNEGILIKELLRATSAAPSYFKPKEITFTDGESAIFIDGGVSMANNPSLMLFLISTIKGYGYRWTKSKDHMLMISVGTGFHTAKVQKERKAKLLEKRTFEWAAALPDMFMKDATEQNQYLMQYFSNSRTPQKINDEAGDLSDDLITEEPLLEYCRYNVGLDEKSLNTLGVQISEKQIQSLPHMEKGENADILYKIGKADAQKAVSESHFPAVFDLGIKPMKVLSQADARKAFAPIFAAKGKRHKKFRPVFARQAHAPEDVASITGAGMETVNRAEKEDYIVKNQTKSQEQYVVKKDYFESRYELVREIPGEDDLSEYIAKDGTGVNAFQLNAAILKSLNLDKHFFLIPEWKEEQYVGVGDFIANPVGKEEVYRIGYGEFIQTYRVEERV